jgi:ribosomal protein L29
MTEVERIRQSVNEENTRRVAEMTQEERDEEVRELKERFGPGLESIMRKRREQRLKKEGEERTPPAETEAGAETHRLASLDGGTDENSLRVKAMSPEERQSEVRELEERFGSTVIDALRQRAAKRAQSSGVVPDKTLCKLVHCRVCLVHDQS